MVLQVLHVNKNMWFVDLWKYCIHTLRVFLMETITDLQGCLMGSYDLWILLCGFVWKIRSTVDPGV